jgi:hypothetical protein
LSAASFKPSGPATIINNTFKIINTSSTIHQQPFKNHETSSKFKHHPPSKIINIINFQCPFHYIKIHQDTSAVPFFFCAATVRPAAVLRMGPALQSLQ